MKATIFFFLLAGVIFFKWKKSTYKKNAQFSVSYSLKVTYLNKLLISLELSFSHVK